MNHSDVKLGGLPPTTIGPDPEFGYKLLVSAATGILVHRLVFSKGEWHLATHSICWAHLLAVGGLALGESLKFDDYLRRASYMALAYFAALWTSIIVYRLFFNQLSSSGIPGPFLAKITKLWHVRHTLTSQNHFLLARLQEEYGDVVQTGPNEVTVYDPAILNLIDGSGNNCTKPSWYDMMLPVIALNTTRDRGDHDSRRKIWNRAFSPEAMRSYKSRITRYTNLLDDYVTSKAGQPVSANDIFYWYTFDIMGDLAYGKSFGMLEGQKWHYAIEWMNEFLGLLGPVSAVPWLARFVFGVPGAAPKWHRFMSWCRNRVIERLDLELDEPNVTSWLIDHARSEGPFGEAQISTLHGDAVLVTIAGSDTTAQTLLFAFYYLAKYKKYQDQLRQELLNRDETLDDFSWLAKCQMLNAVIDETLRLRPPVPTAALRQTGKGGLDIGGFHIPPDTIISAPRYCIARREDCFEKADQFIPERWTTAPHLIKKKEAYAPFSVGRYSCVGKNLALNQIRCLIAQLITKFSVSFVEGTDPNKCWQDFRDNFTGLPGQLDLVFQPVKA